MKYARQQCQNCYWLRGENYDLRKELSRLQTILQVKRMVEEQMFCSDEQSEPAQILSIVKDKEKKGEGRDSTPRASKIPIDDVEW